MVEFSYFDHEFHFNPRKVVFIDFLRFVHSVILKYGDSKDYEVEGENFSKIFGAEESPEKVRGDIGPADITGVYFPYLAEGRFVCSINPIDGIIGIGVKHEEDCKNIEILKDIAEIWKKETKTLPDMVITAEFYIKQEDPLGDRLMNKILCFLSGVQKKYGAGLKIKVLPGEKKFVKDDKYEHDDFGGVLFPIGNEPVKCDTCGTYHDLGIRKMIDERVGRDNIFYAGIVPSRKPAAPYDFSPTSYMVYRCEVRPRIEARNEQGRLYNGNNIFITCSGYSLLSDIVKIWENIALPDDMNPPLYIRKPLEEK